MAQNDAPEGPVEPANEETAVAPAAAPEPAPQASTPTTATRWRETLWTFRSVVAVALASLLVGGAGGALIVAAADDGHDDRGRMVNFDRHGRGNGPKFRNDPFENPGNGPRWRWNEERPRDLTPPTPPTSPQSPTTPSPSQ